MGGSCEGSTTLQLLVHLGDWTQPHEHKQVDMGGFPVMVVHGYKHWKRPTAQWDSLKSISACWIFVLCSSWTNLCSFMGHRMGSPFSRCPILLFQLSIVLWTTSSLAPVLFCRTPICATPKVCFWSMLPCLPPMSSFPSQCFPFVLMCFSVFLLFLVLLICLLAVCLPLFWLYKLQFFDVPHSLLKSHQCSWHCFTPHLFQFVFWGINCCVNRFHSPPICISIAIQWSCSFW